MKAEGYKDFIKMKAKANHLNRYSGFLKDSNGAEYHIQPVSMVLKKSKRTK
jgi:hypothetical protein